MASFGLRGRLRRPWPRGLLGLRFRVSPYRFLFLLLWRAQLHPTELLLQVLRFRKRRPIFPLLLSYVPIVVVLVVSVSVFFLVPLVSFLLDLHCNWFLSGGQGLVLFRRRMA